jgi:4-amino-4-deoxy-L-arabinose transferase-like glycosyltransferase
LAAAGRLAGWEVGPLLMQVLAAVGAVWLCYLAARLLGVGFALAGAGAVMLAVFPVFIFTSIQTLSDTLATTWVLAAFVCGFRARTDRRWAAACGAAFAVSVLVRPTNFLVTPALAVLLGLDARRLLLFVAGGLPGAVWLALYNHNAYGGALRSGYGNPFEAFGLQYGMPTVVHFTKWLSLFLPTIVLLLPIAAWLRRDIPRRELVALGFAIAAIIGVYLFYDVSHDAWWCLRFILPAVGAWIIAGVLGVEALARGPGSRWPGAFRPVAAIVLTLWATGFSWYWVQHLHVLYVPRYEHAYGTMANVVRERLPDNAIVVCSAFSGALYYHTKLPALVYHAMSPGDFARYVRLARQAGRPIYAVVFDIEEEEAIRSRCPGEWKQIASVDNIILWQLE